MDIKDLAGLSEPLKRLIEVVAEGVGAISTPLLTKKNADAKAYEINTIAQAIADSQNLLGPIKYKESAVFIESSPNKEMDYLTEPDISQRVLARSTYQQAKKQLNIEYVIQQAIDDLKHEKEISPEKPDSDWVTRFFNITEDISTDHMQILWGKILAGEIKRPGSFSLRTLELLKNLNQHEAELFVRAGKIAITQGDKVFIPNTDNGKYLKEKFGLSFSDFLILREIDLLRPNDLQLKIYPAEENTQAIFISGNTCIVVNRLKDTPQQNLTIISFTEIGKQLLQLLEVTPADFDYVKKFASFWRREGVDIKSGAIVKQQNDNIRYINLQDIPA